MKLLIALLTAATGILHLLIGFNIVAGFGTTNWLLVLNGLGYLVLLFLYWTSSGSRLGTVRWILLAYALITLIGYFVINAADNYGLNNTVGLVIKAIELLLIILLFLDRGRDRVPAPAASATPSRVSSGTTVSRTGPAVSTAGAETAMGTMATTAGAGLASAAAGAAIGAAALDDRAAEMADEVADDTGDLVYDATDTAGEFAYDAPDRVVDTVDTAGDAVGDAVDTAGDAVGDAVDTVGDAVGDTVDSVDDTMSGAGAAVAGGVAAVFDDADDVGFTDTTIGDADVAAEPTAEQLRADLEEYLRSFGSSSEFRKDIEYVEGIGAVYGQKLRAAGIATVLDLMVNGATRRGRKQIADQSGVDVRHILTWVNHVDLFRIKGVAQEYADLLEQSGVDTVVELAQRNPANLHKRMLDINAQKSLVRRAPHASEVQSWVEQAKSLRRLVHY